jgi:hypothetical protein
MIKKKRRIKQVIQLACTTWTDEYSRSHFKTFADDWGQTSGTPLTSPCSSFEFGCVPSERERGVGDENSSESNWLLIPDWD